MTQPRYFPDANEADTLQKNMQKTMGFSFNQIATEGLLSRWTGAQIYAALLKVFDKNTMGVDATLEAVESYLEKVHP